MVWGPPTVVFESRSFLFNPTGAAAATFDVTADGRRFLMIRVKADSEQPTAAPALIVIVQNRTEELKRLVPIVRKSRAPSRKHQFPERL